MLFAFDLKEVIPLRLPAVALLGLLCSACATMSPPEVPSVWVAETDTSTAHWVVETDTSRAPQFAVREDTVDVVTDTFTEPAPDANRSTDARDIPYTIRETRLIILSAYNSRRNQTDGSEWIGACGDVMTDRDIAYNYLPCGTLVRIRELGPKPFRVADHMPPGTPTNRADMWLYHFRDAIDWGKRMVHMDILGPPTTESPP